ncbi:hypothetical protein FKG94_19445 [Exilibacterium tricleocarpae]|uniref:Uncharacterized protein n=1 Tax=Exilibacterium tricleocarpae TaxID=2591008 RepID=A0A545T3N4_9GAMM|nr:hypothetical protein [Exilibacterium tricleocarpae]TQV71820.1 hypothetical protein FKG94_19445 [Exilibacterium tricleocarpae]
MPSDNLFAPDYWYVVNDHFKHIVYRNKDKAKALRYAESKNRNKAADGSAGIQYSVMSGHQALEKNYRAIGCPPTGG